MASMQGKDNFNHIIHEQTRVNRSKWEIKGVGKLQEQYISLKDLRKVSGIGDKTIERIKAQLLQNELDGNYKSEYNENIKLDVNDIYQGDCLELMNGIPDRSVDMILCDLPYGTTACKWDTIIPFESLWEQYERVIKTNGAIVLFGSEPFSSALRMSNIKRYKYDWIWDKVKPSGHLNAKIMPLKEHEIISIFSKGKCVYNPQGLEKICKIQKKSNSDTTLGNGYSTFGKNNKTTIQTVGNYPRSILTFNKPGKTLHPTQKPVGLCEYLIKTYTNEGDLVLDNCIGSGTTAISAINTNRNYIGIELDENYYNIAKNRINEHKSSIMIK